MRAVGLGPARRGDPATFCTSGGGVWMVVRSVGRFRSLGRVHRSIAPHSASIYASVVSEVKSLRHRTTATSIRHPHNHPGAGSRSHTTLPSAHGTHTSARPCMRPAPALARCLERCGACVHRLRVGIMGQEPEPPYYTRLCGPAALCAGRLQRRWWICSRPYPSVPKL